MAVPARLLAACAAVLLLAAGGCDEDPPAAGDAGRVSVPSGREVRFLDVITNAPGPQGATARFRFVAPDARKGEDWAEDMQALCDGYALPRTDGMVPMPQQIVITVSDREVPFGDAVPEAVQFFESYQLGDGACIWEMF
jgi:hypothetical protein